MLEYICILLLGGYLNNIMDGVYNYNFVFFLILMLIVGVYIVLEIVLKLVN